jgi:alpha-L-fucosidase 2
LRARGGFEVNLAWQDGKLTRLELRSLLGNPCQLRLGDKVLDLKTKQGKSYNFGLDLKPL